MIGFRLYIVGTQHLCQLFHAFSAETIDNAAFTRILPYKFYYVLVYVFCLWANLIIKVGPIEGTFEFRCIQDAQALLDVDTHFVGSCCCQCNYWRIANFVYDWADFPVFWPEIMAPFRYAMCLIYGIERNRYMLQKRNVVVLG